MLRVESESGWWLITHVDHARLAAAFAEHWGNDLFLRFVLESTVTVDWGLCC